MIVIIVALLAPNSWKLTPSMHAAMAMPQRKQVTSERWQSISWRSYQRRNPRRRMLATGSMGWIRSPVGAGCRGSGRSGVVRRGRGPLRLEIGVVGRAHHRPARGVGVAELRGFAREH